MAKLLGREQSGDRRENWWLHTGDDGNDRITVQTVQESDPIIARVDRVRHDPIDRKSAFRFKASIPATLIEDAARINAKEWGIAYGEAFREIMSNRTDRAQRVWKTMTHGRDYRMFQI